MIKPPFQSKFAVKLFVDQFKHNSIILNANFIIFNADFIIFNAKFTVASAGKGVRIRGASHN